jgi:hypothetical protein
MVSTHPHTPSPLTFLLAALCPSPTTPPGSCSTTCTAVHPHCPRAPCPLPLLLQEGQGVVDALATRVTLTPLVQPATASSAPAHLQAAAAAAWVAKLPQLTTLHLHGFTGESLGEWLASPFGSCAALARVTHGARSCWLWPCWSAALTYSPLSWPLAQLQTTSVTGTCPTRRMSGLSCRASRLLRQLHVHTCTCTSGRVRARLIR